MNEVTKKDAAALEFMTQASAAQYTGFENLEEGMLSIPFLKIAQPNSPELLSDDGKKNKLAAGDMFNSVTGRNYGAAVNMVFLGFDRAYLEWGEGLGDFKGRISPQELDQLITSGQVGKQIMKDGSEGFNFSRVMDASKIQETYTFMVLLPEFTEDGVMLLSFKATGLKHVRRILTKARAQRIKLPDGQVIPAHLYAVIWAVKTVLNKSDLGQWFLLGDKKTVAVDAIGNMLEDKWQPVQKAVIDAAMFVKETQFSKVSLAGTRDATPESEE